MSFFNKTVNGVTFTSIFSNIDVRFDTQDLYTHIYISTTDNNTFNSTDISDYYIVHDDNSHDDNSHDDNSLRVIIAMLENDNKTAKLYVRTSEFNKYNSYNIQQLPLPRPYTLADVGLKCIDENATLKVADNTATLTAASGYKITSAKITSQKHHIFQEKYDFTISEDGSSATITLVPSKDLDYNLKVTTEEKPYPLADVGLKCNDENVTLKVTDNTATLTAASGYKITSAKITSEKHHIFQEKYDFTISKDGSSATITLTPSKDLDYNLKVTTEENTPEKPYTLADVGLKCNDENATLKVTDNTATLTAVSGYKITSARITIKQHNIFLESHALTISEDGSSATITLVPSKNLEYDLKVSTEEKPSEPQPQPSQPETKKFNGRLVLRDDVKDKIKFEFDNQITVKISVIDNKYNINSLYYLYQPYLGGSVEKSSNGFTISADKKTATLVIPDDLLDVFRLRISGDIVDTTPLESDKPQPSQPETKKFSGSIILKDDVKDKIKINFDNQKTVKISVIDNKYNINSLYYLYQLHPGDRLENSSNGFTINADKKTATLVIPDNILNVYNIKIDGDIADTTPLKPETTTAKTQRVYMVDDKGLSELTKQAEYNPKVGTNPNYDYTEFINQLYYLPFTVDENLSAPTNKIYTGLRSLDVPAREMKDNVLNIDLGAINVIPENNNGFDYNIESIKLYLPLVLPIQIDFQDCYKKTILINYKINLLNGNATINISSNDKIISTFNQNVQTNLQMFNIYNNKDFGSLNNSINNNLLTPYIKINYYKPVENLVSYETLEHNNLSSYTDYVKTRNASVSCGTQQEQQEIETLLNGGIYIK